MVRALRSIAAHACAIDAIDG
eukprot:SAG31_NODE_12470_length_939_cov_1.234524_2_plen_20_part_01